MDATTTNSRRPCQCGMIDVPSDHKAVFMSALHCADGRFCEAGGPLPMLLWCPECNTRHIDEGEFSTKPHHTHACQGCGMVWRPAVVPTVGVQFLPGFKNAAEVPNV